MILSLGFEGGEGSRILGVDVIVGFVLVLRFVGKSISDNSVGWWWVSG